MVRCSCVNSKGKQCMRDASVKPVVICISAGNIKNVTQKVGN